MIASPKSKVESVELKICGEAAVRARFQRDAGSIVRLYFDYATGRRIGIMCKVLAAARKIYRCVEGDELERIAGSIHHGGVIAVVSQPAPALVTDSDPASWARKRETILVLDRIGNAHNLGAIARTAAFMGLARIVIPIDPGAAQPNDAAYRVAEGGLEWIDVRKAQKLEPFLKALAAAGFDVIGAESKNAKKAVSLRNHTPKAGAPIAIVLGNEEHGLSPEIAAACTRLVTIPGEGRVESLNVSVAAAVLMWELLGRFKAGAH